jgi:hypothetical protein
MEATLKINELGSLMIERNGDSIGCIIMTPYPRIVLWHSHSSLSFNELRDLMKEAEDYHNRHGVIGVPV